jgi:hypothetical protein
VLPGAVVWGNRPFRYLRQQFQRRIQIVSKCQYFLNISKPSLGLPLASFGKFAGPIGEAARWLNKGKKRSIRKFSDALRVGGR